MSSSCSSTDLGIDAIDILTESLLNDIEVFVEHIRQLKKALDSKVVATGEFDCETKCVQVHAALSMVSQSIHDLLMKFPNFKTSNVLIPANHLVYSVKAINFENAQFDAGSSLQAIERLEAAFGTALRHSVNTKLFANENSQTSEIQNQKSIQRLANKPNFLQLKDNRLVEVNKLNFNFVATVESKKNSTSSPLNSLNASVNIAQSNDHFNQRKRLIKTTIKLPELNGSSTMASVTEGCASKTLNSANVGKLKSSKSVGSSMASAVIQLSENDNVEPHNDIPSGSASSSLNSANNSDPNAWSSKDSLSATGSIKSNGTEGRSASVGNRVLQSYISSLNKPLCNVISTSPLKTKQPHVKTYQPNGATRLVRRHSAYQASANRIPNDYVDVDLSVLQKQRNLVPIGTDISTPPSSNAQLMREILTAHENGLELAFERCKSWSKYATHLIMFVRSRLALEQDHMRNRQKLAEQTKSTLVADSCNNYLPLVGIFDNLMDVYGQFAIRMSQTVTNLNQRFITTLENRQKAHDLKRRKLKADWTKQKKHFDACTEELRRAHLTLNSKEGGYFKARDLTMRHEQSVALPQQGGLLSLSYSSASASDTQMKKMKELDKKRKNEEDALTRKTDAENEVWRLEHELDVRRVELNDLRQVVINELCDLIRHCDLTTIACTSHYLKAFLELYAPVPEEYSRLAAYAMRENSPSSDYMSFLHSQLTSPGVNASGGSSACSTSLTSFEKNDNSLIAPSQDLPNSTSAPSSAPISSTFSNGPFQHFVNENKHQIIQQNSTAVISTESYYNSSPSTSSAVASNTHINIGNSTVARRRNALNADEHYEFIAETSQRRQKKSVARLFEQSLSTFSVDVSEAAKSHQLQRTRQVTKCAHCEHLVIFDALKCSTCGIVWHKKCLTSVTVICGPSARLMTEECSAQRRMSIFGVSLKGHLDAQQRQIPLILERCVNELHRRGMSCKGLYRTCGVKSKIEQICVSFEQTASEEKMDLSNVHPMNLASVIKLYLRRLPEPLMTYEMYNDWLQFNRETSTLEVIAQLKELVLKLPQQNYETLKFLIIHLKRVTWFEVDNLMTASNLAAVISPSLIWAKAVDMRQSAAAVLNQQLSNKSSNSCSIPPACASFINDAHQQTKAVEYLIQNAFDVFLVDRTTDWEVFFGLYPNVVKPTMVDDAEIEAVINKKANLSYCSKRSVCDEDDVDDEDDLDDDDENEDENYDICECSESSKTFPKLSKCEINGSKQHDNDNVFVGISNFTITATNTGYSNDERKMLYRRSPSAPASSGNSQMYAIPDLLKNTNICRHYKNSTDDNQSICKKSTTSSSSFRLKRLKNSINASSSKSFLPAGSSASLETSTNSNIKTVVENYPLDSDAVLISQENDLSNLPPVLAKTPKTQRKTVSTGVLPAKQRSFTTSILVSPQSDRKFAALLASRQKQLLKEENAGNSLIENNECEIHKHFNDLRYFSSVLDTRKLSETARSYQRLAQKNDLSESENEGMEEALKQEAKLERQKLKKKLTLCSGEVVVDIKKEQYCLPSYKPGRGAQSGQNGIPLLSASFNNTMSTPDIKVSKIPFKQDFFVDSKLPQKDLLFEKKTNSSEEGNDLPIPQNSTGLLRRKRLERSAAYQSTAFAAATSSLPSGTVVARYGNQPSSDWQNVRLTSKNHNTTNFSTNCNKKIQQCSLKTVTVNENNNLIENTLDSHLQSAVRVIFSGNDVSYV